MCHPAATPDLQHVPKPSLRELSIFSTEAAEEEASPLTVLVHVDFAFYSIKIHFRITIFKHLKMFAFE